MSTELVLPSEIPWEDLKGRDLEECLYWLMHTLGARDLQWRLGGSGPGAADGGRDLEAHFFVPAPDGEITRQSWWIEAKGRSDTVEPSAVREAVITATGRPELDVLVVATNSTFTNPTRDWLTAWQAGTRRPTVHLWDRHHLERLFCEHPEAVIRLFSRALSPQGKLEVVSSRLWNFMSYAGTPLLEELWLKYDELEWSDRSLVAVIMSECANGEVSDRPWLAKVRRDERLVLLKCALSNFYYFCFRANDAGVAQEPYIQGTAYLLLGCLQFHDASAVHQIIQDVWPQDNCDPKSHDIMRRYALSAVINRLSMELSDVCTDDCRRVMMDPELLSKQQIERYWDRLSLPSREATQSRSRLMMENGRRKCKVGLPLGTRVFCPLVRVERDEDSINIERTLTLFKTIMHARVPKASPAAHGTA